MPGFLGRLLRCVRAHDAVRAVRPPGDDDDDDATAASAPLTPEITEITDALDRNIYAASHRHCINILPILPNFDIQNLYPITDAVEKWNILVVGSDKTYILASLKDPFIRMEPEDAGDRLPNRQGHHVMPTELNAFFDPVWDKTLTGRQLQFYIIWNDRLYFINTYPFFNQGHDVIGAILFMRAFHAVPRVPVPDEQLRPLSVPPRDAIRRSHEQALDGVITAGERSRKTSLDRR